MLKRPVRLLSIAGSDPSGGAGIQADLKTFSALKGYGMAVITALTSQNTRGVNGVFGISPAFVASQIEDVLSDVGADAIKIGMLHRRSVVDAVAEVMKRRKVKNLVLDPVMIAKGGHRLLRDDAIESIRKKLLPLATVVTPNIPEASVLSDCSIETNEDFKIAAQVLHKIGARAVIIKGGHGLSASSSDDFFSVCDGKCRVKTFWLRSKRTRTKNTHGTGCTFSSAIAAYLGRGEELEQAVRHAKHYLSCAIEAGKDLKIGHGHGPVHHFWEKG